MDHSGRLAGRASAFALALAPALAPAFAFAFALAFALPLPASAAPPDARLALALTTPRIEKVPDGFYFVLVDAPEVLQAELLAGGELLLDPKMPGEARVFLFSRRLVRVIEVAVDRPLTPPGPAPSGACARPHIDQPCHAPWMKHLLHLAANDAPPLVFELEGLQEQAKVAKGLLLSARLGKVDVAFSAFGVRIKGAKDEAERRRALMAIWPAVLGQLRLFD